MDSWDEVLDQSLLAANKGRFLDPLLQRSVGEFFGRVLNHVRVEGLVFSANISNPSDVTEATATRRVEDNHLDIAEGLGRA